MSSQKFWIRQTHDLDTLCKLDRRIFSGDSPFKPKDYGTYWLAYSGKKPIGFCALHPLPSEPNRAFLARAGVLDRYQGNGLQRRFLRVREQFARKEGYKVLVTYTIMSNFSSTANLIKSNYRLYEPQMEWADEDCLYFMKELK